MKELLSLSCMRTKWGVNVIARDGWLPVPPTVNGHF